jgi:hypothetical protein
LLKNIGRNSVELLKEISELNLHDFGIYIELHPDEEERGCSGTKYPDSFSCTVRLILTTLLILGLLRNTKIASQLLKVRKRRKEKLDKKSQQENIALQAEANQQAAMTAEQAKQQTIIR